MALSQTLLKKLEQAQKNEITEHFVYKRLAGVIRKHENKKILNRIAKDELTHYEFFKTFTHKDFKPGRWRVFKYYWISRIFGVAFGIKLMEKGERGAQVQYEDLADDLPSLKKIIVDEERHELELVNMMNEEQLDYIGSIVLGLNDALVELTGALAGFTFAFQDSRIIALAGLITGIAASFSMGASEYLSVKSEGNPHKAFKSSIYTGGAYLITVMLLVLPFLLISNPYVDLGISLLVAVFIIFTFNYYISVVKDLNFKKRFLEMLTISLSVAGFSFIIGYLVRIFMGVEI
jgi:VIT1/CCC1 family predicted Fe2+/Mn2+ transporter